MGRPTQGVQIRRINLVECSFRWKERPKNAPAEAPRGPMSLGFGVRRQVLRSDPQHAQVVVHVEVKGTLGGVPAWEMSVAYLGEFTLQEPAEVTLQQLLDVHAPAYVYTFCRECVADLARRSRVADDLLIPPFNFQAEEPPGTPAMP